MDGDKKMDGWMDGKVDVWMETKERRMNGWTDGLIDGSHYMN